MRCTKWLQSGKILKEMQGDVIITMCKQDKDYLMNDSTNMKLNKPKTISFSRKMPVWKPWQLLIGYHVWYKSNMCEKFDTNDP